MTTEISVMYASEKVKTCIRLFHMLDQMVLANTPEKSTENIQNTCKIKLYVVEFIQPKDPNII